jgi:glyoxylase-like metal-dependent hydrolase (beta-lactamase superfamily II)
MSDSHTSPPVLLGTALPSVDVWSDRVTVALGQNPSAFTGPGTNTYLVGTGPERILIDTGQGVDSYLDVLEEAMERTGCQRIEQIVLTHGHPDHLGGLAQVLARFGPTPVKKWPWPEVDLESPVAMEVLEDGCRIETEGATLVGVHTPGHAPDHLCFVLEEEGSLFSGDNVLGVGTTVIPGGSGDLGQYMASLERLLALEPGRIYPAHGPCIEDGRAKLREYIDHRNAREAEIIAAVAGGASAVSAMVEIIYAAYPKQLHAAAGASVSAHLLKLEDEGRVVRDGDAEMPPTAVAWAIA